MTKSKDLEKLESILLKVRRRLSDEPNEDEDEVSPEEAGMREFNPDEEGDDADKWLEENDPNKENEDEEPSTESEELRDEPVTEAEAPGAERQAGSPAEGDPAQVAPQEAKEVNKPKYPATRIFGFDDLGQVKSAKSLDQAKEYARSLIDRQHAAFGSNKQKAHQMVDSSKSIDDLMTGMYNTSEKYSKASNKELDNRNKADKGPTGYLPEQDDSSAGSRKERFPQPSKEEIAEMRQYTRPWEQRARDKSRLEAEPSKNPVLHHEGKLVEARNAGHKNYQDAYSAMQGSPEYKDADPVTQMEMDSKFESDFHKQNPDYLSNAAKLHSEAHKKGMGAKDVHAAAKDEAIRHVLGGGAQSDSSMSTEEALQHAGGTKGEEGTVGSMTQDPSSSFAAGNKAFLDQYAKNYANKAKKPKDVNEMMDYDEGSKKDVQRILGEHPALKDPSKKAKVDAFFQKYHPLIGMNAQKVLGKLGIDKKRGDIDLGVLHEAGMHGLMQSINDYDHDHPSKASFSTHASNKIRGLQQTALRSQDQIPQELRTGAKKFQQTQAAPVTRPDIKSLVGKHPPDVADRMKRVDTFKAISKPKAPTTGEE